MLLLLLLLLVLHGVESICIHTVQNGAGKRKEGRERERNGCKSEASIAQQKELRMGKALAVAAAEANTHLAG